MNNSKIITRFFAYLLLLSITFAESKACTVVSCIANNGQVWNMNNEDGPKDVGTFINVYPKTEGQQYGYYTLCYLSPRLSKTAQVQGGMNEAGLTFDFNAIEPTNLRESKLKKSFKNGNDAILTHILSNFESTDEVVDFFQTYWFEDGLVNAQMHVADRAGNFAIISPSGIQKIEKGNFLITTNFDICGQADASKCWRYPIAKELIETNEIALSTMMDVAKQTAQKNGGTMYSNIQNLSTGEIWFFSRQDPGRIVNISLKNLLEQGQRSYSFSNLGALLGEEDREIVTTDSKIELTTEQLKEFEGSYHNSFIGDTKVKAVDKYLSVDFMDGSSELLYAVSPTIFKLKDVDLYLTFTKDSEDRWLMTLYENGFYTYKAVRQELQ